ncbi:hypothetical protein CPC08DRAFT_709470 [Agrocybe pediades]|nr:hypothetical protein CPC08DRAFT_709470 [Agrocybe pediades]
MYTLKLTCNQNPHHPTADPNRILPAFMFHCVESGTPLSVLDLTFFDSQTGMPNLDFLDDALFNHLIIKWKKDVPGEEPIIQEEKCDPKVLKAFRSRYVPYAPRPATRLTLYDILMARQ